MLSVGYTPSTGTVRTALKFPSDALDVPNRDQAIVTNAYFRAYNYYSPSPHVSRPVDLWGITTNGWTRPSVTYLNQPAVGASPDAPTQSFSAGDGSCCNGAWISWDIKDLAQRWMAGQQGFNGVELRVGAGYETHADAVRGFLGGLMGGNSAPVLHVDYAIPPSAPQNANAALSGTSATVTWEAPASFGSDPIDQYLVARYDTQTGYVDSQSTNAAGGTATFTGLADAHGYLFVVYARNNATVYGSGASTGTVTVGDQETGISGSDLLSCSLPRQVVDGAWMCLRDGTPATVLQQALEGSITTAADPNNKVDGYCSPPQNPCREGDETSFSTTADVWYGTFDGSGFNPVGTLFMRATARLNGRQIIVSEHRVQASDGPNIRATIENQLRAADGSHQVFSKAGPFTNSRYQSDSWGIPREIGPKTDYGDRNRDYRVRFIWRQDAEGYPHYSTWKTTIDTFKLTCSASYDPVFCRFQAS